MQAPPPAPAEDRRARPSTSRTGGDRRPPREAHPPTAARPRARRPALVWGPATAGASWSPCGTARAQRGRLPDLTGITVLARLRGPGLGLAVTAYLTRQAVAEAGVCTLGMYSHNAVARGLYLALGYDRRRLCRAARSPSTAVPRRLRRPASRRSPLP